MDRITQIMTAPFVIAHWQVGETLKDTPLQDGERAAIYLTNALTGWTESEAGPAIPGYEALVEERSAATAIKRERPILVVLGNPPYNAYAGLSPDDEGDLVEAYKKGLRAVWGVKKFNLDELYVRFFRIAERRVAENTGRGIVREETADVGATQPMTKGAAWLMVGNSDQAVRRRYSVDNISGRRSSRSTHNAFRCPNIRGR